MQRTYTDISCVLAVLWIAFLIGPLGACASSDPAAEERVPNAGADRERAGGPSGRAGESSEPGTNGPRPPAGPSSLGPVVPAVPDVNACPGVDLETSPTNCGACGHDCRGTACRGGDCEIEVFSTVDLPPGSAVTQFGVDAGKLVIVVESLTGVAESMSIYTVDPSAPVGTRPRAVAKGLFPRIPRGRVSIADGSVYVLRASSLSRVFLADGHVETWSNFEPPRSQRDVIIAGYGNRALTYMSSNVYEYTNAAGGFTGRSAVLAGVSDDNPLIVREKEAFLVGRSEVYRIDLATFESEVLFNEPGVQVGALLGKPDRRIFFGFQTPARKRIYSLDTTVAGAPAVLIAEIDDITIFLEGATDGSKLLVTGSWGDDTRTRIGMDLVKGTRFHVPRLGPFSVVLAGYAWTTRSQFESQILRYPL